jgi:hypothetical protein
VLGYSGEDLALASPGLGVEDLQREQAGIASIPLEEPAP